MTGIRDVFGMIEVPAGSVIVISPGRTRKGFYWSTGS